MELYIPLYQLRITESTRISFGNKEKSFDSASTVIFQISAFLACLFV